MKKGQYVIIKRRKAQLKRKLSDVKGGWVIDRLIMGFACWNELDMKLARVQHETWLDKARRSNYK